MVQRAYDLGALRTEGGQRQQRTRWAECRSKEVL